MPTIPGIPGAFRRFFYSFDCVEPMHVHVERDRSSCKVWAAPLVMASNDGFNLRELGQTRALLFENTLRIRRAWNAHGSQLEPPHRRGPGDG